MAQQVPYSPTQEVAPQLNPLPQVHVDTPPAAFGSTVAAAVEHLGDTAQGVGKELFARAVGFQELNEQVKADEAAANTTDVQTQIYMDYDKKKGQERVDAFPQYVKDLEEARNKGGEGLTSPYAKQKYLEDSRRGQSQMIWHGGVLARQGQDEATTIAADSKANAAVQRFSTLDPNDTKSWDGLTTEIRQSMEEEVYNKGGPKPGTPEAAAAALPKISSKIKAALLAKANSDNPEFAKVLLKRAQDQKLITPEDADSIQWKLDNGVDNKVARKIGAEVGSGSAHKKPSDVAASARSAAEKADPGNKPLADAAEDSALARQAHEQSLETETNRFTLQTLRRGIDGTDTNGKVPLSLEGAELDPKWKDAYLSAPSEVQGAIREQIRKNQTTDGWVPNEAGTKDFNSIYSVLKDPRSSAAEMDEALNRDPIQTHMTREQRKVIGDLQDKILADQSSPPSINTALGLPSVKAAIAHAQLQKGSDDYNSFVTEFSHAIERYTEGGHHTVKDDEQLGKIANAMLVTQSRGLFHLFSTDPMFKDPFAAMPGLKAQAIGIYKEKYGRMPTENDLATMSQMMYNRYFKDLGEKSRPAKPKPNRSEPNPEPKPNAERGPQ